MQRSRPRERGRKVAFEEILDDFFDQKLPLFIDHVSKAIANVEDHAEQDADLLLNYTFGNLTSLADHVAAVAQQLIDKTVQEVL